MDNREKNGFHMCIIIYSKNIPNLFYFDFEFRMNLFGMGQ